MSNLIITIISIALIAIAAVMGIYYGGAAYVNANAQAAANKIMSDAQQMAAAFLLYSQANNGTTGTPGLDDGNNDETFAFLVIPKYLTQLPTIPASITPPTMEGTGDNLTNAGYNGGQPFNSLQLYQCVALSPDNWQSTRCGTESKYVNFNHVTPPVSIYVSLSMNSTVAFSKQVCQLIANKARGNNAPIDAPYTIDLSTQKFDCAAEPATDITGGSSPAYDFAYRIM